MLKFDLTNSVLSSGGKTGPDPTPPKPDIPTTTPYPDETTTTTTTRPVDPTKDACKIDKYDTITVIDEELHFFKDG